MCTAIKWCEGNSKSPGDAVKEGLIRPKKARTLKRRLLEREALKAKAPDVPLPDPMNVNRVTKHHTVILFLARSLRPRPSTQRRPGPPFKSLTQPQLLSALEEDDLVSVLTKFEESGYAATRAEVSEWVIKALELRRVARAASGNMAKRLPKLSLHAKDLLKRLKVAATTPGSKPVKISRCWFAGFYRRHPILQETNATKSISPQRAMASSLGTRDFLFAARTRVAEKLGMKMHIFNLLTAVGILKDGVLDKSRIFNSDECPNPINGNPSGTKSRPKVISVMKSGTFSRPVRIGQEKHDEQVTIDPIISFDGKMWTTQVVNHTATIYWRSSN